MVVERRLKMFEIGSWLFHKGLGRFERGLLWF